MDFLLKTYNFDRSIEKTTVNIFDSIDYSNKLSNFSGAKLCIPTKLFDCDSFSLCDQIDLCCLGNGGGVVFSGYIFRIKENFDTICLEIIDCLSRYQYRIITENYIYNNRDADTLVQEIRNDIISDAPMTETLGLTEINENMENVRYLQGMSFYDILVDISSKTGAEFRCKEGEIRIAKKSDTNPGGVGVKYPGEYIYNPNDQGLTNIQDYEIEYSLENFCNINYSKDTNNLAEPLCEHRDDDSVTDCGVRQCFSNDPDGQNTIVSSDIEPNVAVELDTACVDWCGICVGDRMDIAIFTQCSGKVLTETVVRCITVSVVDCSVDVTIETGTDGSRGGTNKDLYKTIFQLNNRIKNLEIHS